MQINNIMQIILGPMSLLFFSQTRGTLLCGVKWKSCVLIRLGPRFLDTRSFIK